MKRRQKEKERGQIKRKAMPLIQQFNERSLRTCWPAKAAAICTETRRRPSYIYLNVVDC